MSESSILSALSAWEMTCQLLLQWFKWKRSVSYMCVWAMCLDCMASLLYSSSSSSLGKLTQKHNKHKWKLSSHGLTHYINFSYSISTSSTMYTMYVTQKEMWKYVVFHCKYNKEAFCWLMSVPATPHWWMGLIQRVEPLPHFCHGNSFKGISSCWKESWPAPQPKHLRNFRERFQKLL